MSATYSSRSPARARASRAANASRSSRGWGGARAGAGRPKKHAIASEPHKARPALSAHHPVLVTTRVLATVAPLRRRAIYRALRSAVGTSLARSDFRIVGMAVRAARLELLVEADDKHALARGMQGFQVAAARRLNTALARRGTVFPDRYRAAILRTRAAVRAAAASLVTATAPAESALSPAWPASWLLRIELGRVRPRPRW